MDIPSQRPAESTTYKSAVALSLYKQRDIACLRSAKSTVAGSPRWGAE